MVATVTSAGGFKYTAVSSVIIHSHKKQVEKIKKHPEQSGAVANQSEVKK
jgi:hypothetical protein